MFNLLATFYNRIVKSHKGKIRMSITQDSKGIDIRFRIPTAFFNISRRFEDFMKKEKFENVSITDFSRGGAKSYRERQAMFHEFFAEETTRVLMNKHLLGAFSKGVSKTFSHLIEASRKQLTDAGMKVDRTTFASDMVNSILDGNKESIKQYGKTIFEKIELDNNNKLVSGVEPMFKNNTLEEVRQRVGSRGWETKQDILYRDWETDRKSTRLNSSHSAKSRMPSSA